MSLSLERSAATDISPWAGIFPLDTATPITAVHLGLEYRGEVIRAARRSANLAQTPGPGSHFKIVLLQNRSKLGLSAKLDARVAVCMPVAPLGGQTQRIIGEITAAKEAAYLTRRDVDAAAINSALRERRDGLQSRLIEEESARFSKGEILVSQGAVPDLSDIYTDDDPQGWMENLACWLLSRCFPSLPIETSSLTEPVCEDEIAGIFAGIFSQSGIDPVLTTALGLSDNNTCSVFTLIRHKIGTETTSFREVHTYLTDEVGLTGKLASLLMTLFVHYESPEFQIQLPDFHGMSRTDGSPLLGTRLTPDLIPPLIWDDDLADKALSIGPDSLPRFSDARHHLSVFSPDQGNHGEHLARESIEKCLSSIVGKVAIARRVLLSIRDEESSKLEFGLDRLSQVTGDDHRSLYHSIRSAYPSLTQLENDLDTLRELFSLKDDFESIRQTHTYISRVQVPASGSPDLTVDRETLLAGLSTSQLLGAKSRAWNAVSQDTEAFKLRYIHAYQQHHQQFHDALPGFQAELSNTKKKAVALGLFDTLAELGLPAGQTLELELSALPFGPSPCPVRQRDLDLSTDPVCPNCEISLAQCLPTAELARLAPQIDMALGEKTQNLSKLLVEKALAGNANERWNEFLQIVQASELSSLANTLDSDIVAFIREVLN